MPPAVPDDERRNLLLASRAAGAYRIVIELAEPRRFRARASDAL